jgi:hypothetical protein
MADTSAVNQCIIAPPIFGHHCESILGPCRDFLKCAFEDQEKLVLNRLLSDYLQLGNDGGVG